MEELTQEEKELILVSLGNSLADPEQIDIHEYVTELYENLRWEWLPIPSSYHSAREISMLSKQDKIKKGRRITTMAGEQESKLDYKRMWEKLREEIRDVKAEEVEDLNPHIVLSYMYFIEQVETLEHRVKDLEIYYTRE